MRMRSLLLAACFSPLSVFASVPLWIGTGGGDAKGIYRADFDPETGKIGGVSLAAEYGGPGFLALYPEKSLLYAIGSPREAFADGSGAVAVFSIGADASLEFLAEASSGGRGPCHLALDAEGRTLAVANYSDGRIATIRLDENGRPGNAVSVITNTGKGPNAERQEGPHAHGVYFDTANRHLFVPDLGLDKVLVYRFSAETSEISAHTPAALETAPGAGPRHMAFSPDERHAYVINELDQTVLVADHGKGRGTFEAKQTVPTLPADFTEFNKISEIEVHPNGRFVYGSNRGHDSIVVFRRDEKTGELAFVQHAPCGGKTPRHFKIDPTGRWLLCAHQDSDSIAVLPLDPETGRLGAPVSIVSCPRPICLLFRPSDSD